MSLYVEIRSGIWAAHQFTFGIDEQTFYAFGEMTIIQTIGKVLYNHFPKWVDPFIDDVVLPELRFHS
jgi:hypothetical protein